MANDTEVLRRHLGLLEESDRAIIAARRERALRLARRAAALLREQHGATRVVLYGSLARPLGFGLRSDVDLAGWGVQDYFRAVSRLLDLDPSIEVNLVVYEEASSGLREAIDDEGMEL